MKNVYLRSFVSSILLTSISISSPTPASAATYVTISGQVTNSVGIALSSPSIALAKVSSSEIIGNLDSQGRYSINVPTGTPIELTFVIYEEGSLVNSGFTSDVNRLNPGFSNWTTKISSINEDRVINFKLPPFVQLEVKVTDAQNNNLSNLVLYSPNANQSHNSYMFGDLQWTGIQRSASSVIWFVSRTGLFTFQFYPTDNFTGFSYWQTTNVSSPSEKISGIFNSPAFSILSNKSIQLCIPVNFGSSKSTPASCLENQPPTVVENNLGAAADKSAAAAAAAAAEKHAAAASKIKTIICVKGKISKKFSSSKPKCPSGFKLKK